MVQMKAQQNMEQWLTLFFFRYLGNFQSKVFISYFSYKKPIVSFLEYGINDDASEENLPE